MIEWRPCNLVFRYFPVSCPCECCRCGQSTSLGRDLCPLPPLCFAYLPVPNAMTPRCSFKSVPWPREGRPGPGSRAGRLVSLPRSGGEAGAAVRLPALRPPHRRVRSSPSGKRVGGARGREITAPSLQAVVLSPPSPHGTGQVHHGERRVGLRGDPLGDSHLLPGAALFTAVGRAGHREHRGVLPGPGQAGESCWGRDAPSGARRGGDGA